MDATIHGLGRILLNSVPTFLLFTFVVIYLRIIFFQPLSQILKQRYEETEGARKAAAESMRQAELRIEEYEIKLRNARGEIYAEQGQFLKRIERDHAAQLETTRRETEAHVAKAMGEIRTEADVASRTLESRSSELSDQIVSRVLEGRAA